jgi:hypothetical protein
LCIGTGTAKAGPFEDFFRKLRRAMTQPEEQSRRHRHARKQKQNDVSADGSNNKTSPDSSTPAPPNADNTRVAKATSATKAGKSDLRYGIPVPGKQGFVTSPFAPESGYVDVRGYPPGTEVKDPYTGKSFLTP